MKVLVTGSAGNIGRELVRSARDAGHELCTFDRAAAPKDHAEEHHPGDLRDIAAIRRAVQGVEAVLHLGALAHDGAGTPEDVLSVNVQGTWNVLLACVEAEVKRVVFFSSVNALGYFGGRKEPETLPVDDAYPHHPRSPYQLSKHLAEETCRSFSDQHGIVAIGLRPAFVSRPQHYERWRERRGSERSEWGRGEFWAYVDIRDVCDAALQGLTAENVTYESFLLTADDTRSDTPTETLVREHFPGVAWPKVSLEEYVKDQPHRSVVDCSRAKEVLGWQPKHSWRDE